MLDTHKQYYKFWIFMTDITENYIKYFLLTLTCKEEYYLVLMFVILRLFCSSLLVQQYDWSLFTNELWLCSFFVDSFSKLLHHTESLIVFPKIITVYTVNCLSYIDSIIISVIRNTIIDYFYRYV